MTDFKKEDIVYCDANFFVAYGAAAVKQSEDKKRAAILLAKLLRSKCRIAASALTFDEAWHGIKTELDPKSGIKQTIDSNALNLDSLLKKLGLMRIKKVAHVQNHSYDEIHKDLENFTEALLKNPNFVVFQFNDVEKGVKDALMNIKKFNLKPRDAFHFAISQDNNATHFITNDKILHKKPVGVKFVDYKS